MGRESDLELKRIEVMPVLPKRPADAHKGTFGTVLVIAGSRGMSGAAALCGVSALRSGAGLTRVACPAEVQPVVASLEPSYTTYPLPNDDDGVLRFDAAVPILERFLPGASVVAAGPGLGQSADVTRLVTWLIERSGRPLVLDADALNALVDRADTFARATNPVVITPHPGEFGRLLGISAGEVQAAREELAAGFARRFPGLVVLLKGSGTIVTDGKRLAVNGTGNPGMASGGVGDVLTGVVAGLMAQGLPAFDAAHLGAYVHGLAGDVARDQNGEIGMIAGDVVDALADAFYHLNA